MPSYLTWLDASAEAQRRAREMLALFRQAESRDELGIGQLRDAFSDALFPGTSTIQTRARYFLFVPWLFQVGERVAGREGQGLQRWVHGWERTHIGHLRNHTTDEGLIGREAGAGVKILPSTIYWSGLIRYGILTRPIGPDQLRRVPRPRREQDAEATERPPSNWVATLPDPPPGFPSAPPAGLAMLADEAKWLRERILDAVPGTMLAHLLVSDDRTDPASDAAWLDPGCRSADGDALVWLEHAALFSTAMHGAALLFNLMIAERYRDAGLTRIEAPIDFYRAALSDWSGQLAAVGPQLAAWDRADLWTRIHHLNPRVSLPTRQFVESWVDATRRTTDPDSPTLRSLVEQRERRIKRAQSRLVNERMLRAWSGASGAARLTFRWGQVRRMVHDIRTAVSDHALT